MSHQQGFVDKTRVFRALEQELRAGGSGASGVVADDLAACEEILAEYVPVSPAVTTALRYGMPSYECTFLRAQRHVPWVDATVRAILDDFRAARDIAREDCFTAWAAWVNVTDRAIRNFASTACLQGDKGELAPELLVKSLFRDIGDMLESSFQPFARQRLLMRGIARRWATSSGNVVELSFGQVIAHLSAISPGGEVYRPGPFGIPVSQWRNIAQHSSYDLRGGTVECTYGTPGSEKQLRLTPTELLDVARYVNTLYYAHKVAFEFFTFEHVEELAARVTLPPLTQHTLDSALAAGIVAAGFSFRIVGHKQDTFALVLADPHNRPEAEAKAALQEASVPYAVVAGPVQIDAIIQSDAGEFWFSFWSAVPGGGRTLPTGLAWEARRLGEKYRLGPAEPLADDQQLP